MLKERLALLLWIEKFLVFSWKANRLRNQIIQSGGFAVCCRKSSVFDR